MVSGLALTIIGFAFASLVVRFFTKHYLASLRPRNFPPGPPPVPFLGNLWHLPTEKVFLKFHQLGKQYGHIVGLKFGPQNVVVLNHHQHVKALLDKRGAIYSSRPENHIGNDILYPGSTHILMLPYGDAWRQQRKVFQSVLNINAVDRLLPIQNAEATQMMFQLAQSPEDYFDHIRSYATAVILASVYGQRGASFDSPHVQALWHALEQFTEIMSLGATPPVDAFPFLKMLPDFLCPWRTWGKAIRKEQRALYFKLMQEARDKVPRGQASDSFMRKLFEKQEKEGFDDEHIAYIGGAMMEAGSDTTASTLLSFILAMLKYPQAFRKAQAEVDMLCGDSRSPDSRDFNSLTYLRATMNETLRWRPVAPLGFPHSLTEDDTYEGYFLPKGTIVFANAWSIHRDETEYDQPEAFLPERFLGSRFGTRYNDETDGSRRQTYSFGSGRRICPAQRLAENSLMMNMAKLVWAFDFFPRSAGVVDVDVQTAYIDGVAITPKLVPIIILPRSKQRKRIIDEEYKHAKAQFAKYEES